MSPSIRRLVLDPRPQRVVIEQPVEQLSAARPLHRVGGSALEHLRQREFGAGRPSLAHRILIAEVDDVRELHLVWVPSLDGLQRHQAGLRTNLPERPRHVERELPALGDRGPRLENGQLLGPTTFRRGGRVVADTAGREEIRAVLEALVIEDDLLDRPDRTIPVLALRPERGPLQVDVDDPAALVRDEVDRLFPIVSDHDVHSDRIAGRGHLAFDRETVMLAGGRDRLPRRGARGRGHERHG